MRCIIYIMLLVLVPALSFGQKPDKNIHRSTGATGGSIASTVITSGFIQGDGTLGDPVRFLDGTAINNMIRWDGGAWVQIQLSSLSDSIFVQNINQIIDSTYQSFIFGDSSTAFTTNITNNISDSLFQIFFGDSLTTVINNIANPLYQTFFVDSIDIITNLLGDSIYNQYINQIIDSTYQSFIFGDSSTSFTNNVINNISISPNITQLGDSIFNQYINQFIDSTYQSFFFGDSSTVFETNIENFVYTDIFVDSLTQITNILGPNISNYLFVTDSSTTATFVNNVVLQEITNLFSDSLLQFIFNNVTIIGDTLSSVNGFTVANCDTIFQVVIPGDTIFQEVCDTILVGEDDNAYVFRNGIRQLPDTNIVHMGGSLIEQTFINQKGNNLIFWNAGPDPAYFATSGPGINQFNKFGGFVAKDGINGGVGIGANDPTFALVFVNGIAEHYIETMERFRLESWDTLGFRSRIGMYKFTGLAPEDNTIDSIYGTDTDGVLKLRAVSSLPGGGGADLNFAEDDLTADGDRSHTFASFDFTIGSTGSANSLVLDGLTGNMGINVSSATAGTGDELTILGNISIEDGNSSVYIGQVVAPSGSGVDNVGLGSSALSALTTGTQNVAIGTDAMNATATVDGNVGVGFQAGMGVTGANNVAVGWNALATGGAISNNIAIGDAAQQNATGINNAAVGVDAFKVGSGNNNTAIGNFSLDASTTGFNNTAVGFNASTALTTFSNTSSLGFGAEPDASNQVVLGNKSITQLLADNFRWNVDQALGPGLDGYVMSYNDATGELELADGSGAPGLTDTNMAENDLTADGDRTHDFATNSLVFNNVGTFDLNTSGSSASIDAGAFVRISGTSVRLEASTGDYDLSVIPALDNTLDSVIAITSTGRFRTLNVNTLGAAAVNGLTTYQGAFPGHGLGGTLDTITQIDQSTFGFSMVRGDYEMVLNSSRPWEFEYQSGNITSDRRMSAGGAIRDQYFDSGNSITSQMAITSVASSFTFTDASAAVNGSSQLSLSVANTEFVRSYASAGEESVNLLDERVLRLFADDNNGNTSTMELDTTSWRETTDTVFSYPSEAYLNDAPDDKVFFNNYPSGTLSITGAAGQMTSSSDLRKKDIVDIRYTISPEDYMTLRPIVYTWKNDTTETRHLGFGAQDVLPIIPEAVGGSEETSYGIHNAALIGANVAFSQHLYAELRAEQLKVKELEMRVAQLEKLIKK